MNPKVRYILCIDQATANMGWSLCAINEFNFKPLKYGLHKSKSTLPNGERYYLKMNFIRSIIEQLSKSNIKISCVILEEVPMHNDKPKVRDVLNQLLGCIKMGLWLDNIDLEEQNPNHWKARVGIRSKDKCSQKVEGMARVKDMFGIEVETDDVSDSILIGLASTKDGLYNKIIERERIEFEKSEKAEKKRRKANNEKA